MKQLLSYFGNTGDAEIERAFRLAYEEPGVRYLQVAFFFAALGFACFLLLDVLNERMAVVPGVQAFRVGVTALFVLAMVLTHYNQDFISRNYSLCTVPFYTLGILCSALLPLAIHGTRSTADFYWSLNSSLTTSTIVVYGFTRLPARLTAVIVILTSLAGFATAFMVPAFDPYAFGRLIVHMLFVNVASYSLRAAVERRERALFMLARDNLSKNIYARELEASRALAEEGSQVKQRFLETMSHEFRTPMNGMIQTLELAGRGATDALSKLIGQAMQAGHALLATLNSILEYSRWTNATTVPVLGSVDVAKTARLAAEAQRDAYRDLAANLEIHLRFPEDANLVWTDQLMLDAILAAVLGNAVRFGGGGRIDLSFEIRHKEQGTGFLDITIEDRGIGIPKEALQRVFTPFYQVDSSSTRPHGGTGLGLAVVRRLVDILQGHVTIKSVEGVGTTVRVTIPVTTVASASVVGTTTEAATRASNSP